MDCQTFDEKLYEYDAGTLDAPARSQVEAHTAACPRCARELADYRQTVRVLATAKHPVMPESFWAAQRERVMAVVRRALDVRPWQAPRYSLVVLIAIVAGYVVAGLDIMGGITAEATTRSDSSSYVFTLIPLYAFMLVLAVLTFRERPAGDESSGRP
jgi:anti-sigma factor RsiW